VHAVSGVMQDYLKAVYKLQQGRDAVSTSDIAERLGVSAASATNMVKRLARLRLVAYAPYQGFALTTAGEKIALEIIRHHRLIELYLAQQLGVPLEQVHAEAERMEHVLSDEVEARMASALGNPAQDPHGDPIPASDGTMRDVRYPKLETLAPGASGVVAHVGDESPALLRRLAQLGVVPGVVLRMLGRRRNGCEVEIKGHRFTLSRSLSETVHVQ
jgi:DtxR family transcriptional regulator, Mn-dependent transcriptional regulator